jgi:hypothetical protein
MQLLRALLLALPLSLCASCAIHSTANEWNQRIGSDGKPVFYTSTTKVGLNLLVAVPFLGRLSIDGMVNDMTKAIAKRGGDRVRIVQGDTENYWYGFPPFTWIATPVVSTLTAEYQPNDEELVRAFVELELEEDDDLTEEEALALAVARVKDLREATGDDEDTD